VEKRGIRGHVEINTTTAVGQVFGLKLKTLTFRLVLGEGFAKKYELSKTGTRETLQKPKNARLHRRGQNNFTGAQQAARIQKRTTQE